MNHTEEEEEVLANLVIILEEFKSLNNASSTMQAKTHYMDLQLKTLEVLNYVSKSV